MEKLLLIGFAGALIALAFAALQRRKVLSFSEGNENMRKIAAAIRQGIRFSPVFLINPLFFT